MDPSFQNAQMWPMSLDGMAILQPDGQGQTNPQQGQGQGSNTLLGNVTGTGGSANANGVFMGATTPNMMG